MVIAMAAWGLSAGRSLRVQQPFDSFRRVFIGELVLVVGDLLRVTPNRGWEANCHIKEVFSFATHARQLLRRHQSHNYLIFIRIEDAEFHPHSLVLVRGLRFTPSYSFRF